MNKEQIVAKASSTLSKARFEVSKRSPEILMVTGVIGVIGSTVMACRATLKVTDVLEEHKTKVDSVNQAKEAIKNGQLALSEYPERDQNRDMTVIYAQTSVQLATLYGPAIILGTLSILSIFASNNILRKRNVALAAAYATIDKGFKEYRNRVVDRFGEEVDRELKYNVKAKKVEETVIGDDGKEKKVKKTVDVSDLGEYSAYARFFDEGSRNWEKNPEYNLMFLRAQQQFANDKLRANGHLFLNEVYDSLGIPRTKAGQVVGWRYDEKNPTGDNYVDFGIYETHREKARDFVNGYESVILLDFNVDGDILSDM